MDDFTVFRDALRLAGKPLSEREKAVLLLRLEDLLRFLGAPGDWGYNTKLGALTRLLIQFRRDVAFSQTEEAARGA